MKTLMAPVFRLVCLIAIVCFESTFGALAADSTNLPGTVTEIKSPDGEYTLQNVDEPREGSKDIHHLYLTKKGRAGRSDLHTYGRNVDTIWSPNSDALIINDWLETSHAESKLYHMNNLAYPISIGTRLLDAIKNTPEARLIARSGHNYIFVSKWINSRKIEVKVASYGSPEGEFTLYYVWDLRESFRQIKRDSKFRTDKDLPPSN